MRFQQTKDRLQGCNKQLPILKGVTLLLLSFPLCAFAQFAGTNSLAEVQTALQSQFAEAEVRFVLENPSPTEYVKKYAKFEPLTAQDLELMQNYAGLFAEEWAKYPPDWLKFTELTEVVFVKDLFVVSHHRAAMPDPEGRALYLDITYFNNSQTYTRKTIHHEFYHLIEIALNGKMFYRDRKWRKINDRDFEYGEGGAAAYSDPAYRRTEHPLPGFVSAYATYAVEEDKAEVFAYLMSDHLHPKLMQWVTEDEILNEKVEKMLEDIEDEDTSFGRNHITGLHR